MANSTCMGGTGNARWAVRARTAVIVLALVGIFRVAGAGVAAVGTWSLVPDMLYARSSHTATTLLDGRVLVTGGEGYDPSGEFGYFETVETYDPAAGSWSLGAPMSHYYVDHTATLLTDGRVLVVGFGATTNTAEIYNPTIDSWAAAADAPATAQLDFHTATLLRDGRVLITGGIELNGSFGSTAASIYDPLRDRWRIAQPMSAGRRNQEAVLLRDGRILVVGGNIPYALQDAEIGAEVYDPLTDRWSSAESPPIVGLTGANTPTGVSATVLDDGDVIVAGACCIPMYLPCNGWYCSPNAYKEPLRFSPDTGLWTPAGVALLPRADHDAHLLPDGSVLVLGGLVTLPVVVSYAAPQAERFLPLSNSWVPTQLMKVGRVDMASARLSDGRILVMGGDEDPGHEPVARRWAEVFTP